MSTRQTVGAIALVLVGFTSRGPILGAHDQGRASAPTDKAALYVLKVSEPGYDVVIRETERAAKYSVIEVNGVVPTVTAGGVVVFKAVQEIAKARSFEYTFTVRPPQER